MTAQNMIYLWFSLSLLFSACALEKNERADNLVQTTIQVKSNQDDCNWCDTSEAPEHVTWRTVIPPEVEPGERLIISGTVFNPDGKTSAEGIIVYVHHTNIDGIYPKKGNEGLDA